MIMKYAAAPLFYSALEPPDVAQLHKQQDKHERHLLRSQEQHQLFHQPMHNKSASNTVVPLA